MAAKYCPQAYPCMVDVFQGDSHIWRRMLATQKQVEQNMISLLGSGVSNFWFKNWLGSGPLCQRLENLLNHQVQDFVSSGRWNQQLLLQWVPSPVVAKILRKDPSSSYQSDRIIWKTSQSGVFLLLQNRLPIASFVMKFGVQGPSKCFCCAQLQAETLDHVFSEGDFALQLWQFFGLVVGITYLGRGVRSKLAAWWFCHSSNGFLAFVYEILPTLICWQIWKARNRKVKPLVGEVKINTDGCFVGNPGTSGGGGILCDDNGGMVFVFAALFGEMSSVQAETKALLVGLQQCLSYRFDRLHVEVDSLLLVRILLKKAEGNQVADALSKVGATASSFCIFDSHSALSVSTRVALRMDLQGVPFVRRRCLCS
ncbi:uncharacterized protein [Coffea arabica]|uniref:RNase H type-1 domain-containing protein n=1 Tax=Coffea arabica TaxID=13443 RepID=A0ABM4UEM7_COFAR